MPKKPTQRERIDMIERDMSALVVRLTKIEEDISILRKEITIVLKAVEERVDALEESMKEFLDDMVGLTEKVVDNADEIASYDWLSKRVTALEETIAMLVEQQGITFTREERRDPANISAAEIERQSRLRKWNAEWGESPP